MICALPKCRIEFEPKRRNRIYHSRRCRLEAKSEKTVLIRVPADQACYIKAMLARRKSGVHRLSLLSGTELLQQDKEGGEILSTPNSSKYLSPSEFSFLNAMRTLGFGRYEQVQIRNGEIIVMPWPTSIQAVKFGGHFVPETSINTESPALKQQETELFDYIRGVKAGEIRTLEIRHGIPFSMEITLDGTVDPEGARQSPAQAFGPRS
jgi:hypothetical protein